MPRYAPNAVPKTDLTTFLGFELRRIAEHYSNFYREDSATVVEGSPEFLLTGVASDGSLRNLVYGDPNGSLKVVGTDANNSSYIDFWLRNETPIGYVGGGGGEMYIGGYSGNADVAIYAYDGGAFPYMLQCIDQGAVRAFYDGKKAMETMQYGINVYDTNASGGTAGVQFFSNLGTQNATIFVIAGTAFHIRGNAHGDPVKIQAENVSGVVKDLVYADPDSDSYLHHAGVKALGTSVNGSITYPSSGATYAGHILQNSTSGQSRFMHYTDDHLYIDNLVDSKAINIRTKGSDSATRTILQLLQSTTNPAIGFLGTTAKTKQTVTGSRGGNAALASLLTALANFGLITDSTT